MTLTRAQLEKMLDENNQADKPNSKEQKLESGGKAYFDMWLLMQDDDNCFVEFQTAKSNDQRKKIIICDGLINEREITSYEADFINGLIKYYDVYLWPGNNVPLSECKPLSSTAQYWVNRSKLHPATAEEVQEKLAAQSLAVADYVILDRARNFMILNRANDAKLGSKLEVIGEESLSIMVGGLNFDDVNTKQNIQASLSPLSIKSTQVDTHSLQHIPELIKTFTNLEKIEIERAVPAEKIDGILPYIENKHVHVKNLKVEKSNVVLGETRPNKKKQVYKSLTIDAAPKCKEMEIANMQVSVLKVSAKHLTQLKLASTTSIEEINLSDIGNLQGVTLCPGIKSLIINSPTADKKTLANRFLCEIDLSQQNQLEEIQLYKCYELESLTGLQANKIRRLTIVDCEKLDKIDVTAFTQLEEVKFNDVKLKKFKLSGTCKSVDLWNMVISETVLANLNNLENLILTKVKFDEEGDTQFPNFNSPKLKSLYLNTCIDVRSIPLARMPALKVLNIEYGLSLKYFGDFSHSPLTEISLNYCNNLTELPLEKFPHLSKLILKNNSRFETIDLSKNLKMNYLKIKNDKKLKNLDISPLKQLEKLELSQNIALENVKFSNANLKELIIRNCPNLVHMDFSQLTQLESLELDEVRMMEQIKLPKSLKRLTLNKLSNIENIDFSQLPNLEHIEIKDIEDEITLEKLNLNASALVSLANVKLGNLNLSHIEAVNNITIFDCTDIASNNFPAQCATININDRITRKIDLSNVKGVENISINKSVGANVHWPLNSIVWPTDCESVKQIDLSSCAIEELDLTKFKNLEILTIHDVNLKNLKLPFPSNLKSISISECSDLNAIDFTQHQQLEVLNLSDANQTALNLAGMGKLKVVNVKFTDSDFVSVNVSQCKDLRKLEVHNNADLTVDLTACPRLAEVTLKSTGKVKCSSDKDSHYLQQFNLISDQNEEKVSIPTFYLTRESFANTILSDLNGINPVSLLDIDKEEYVDNQTGREKKAYQASGSFKVTLITNKPVDRDKYRIRIEDGVAYDNGCITFTKDMRSLMELPFQQTENLNADLIARKKAFASQNPNNLLGMVEIKNIEANKLYPLPNLSPAEYEAIHLYTNPPNAGKLFWHPGHQLHYIKFEGLVTSENIQLLYHIKYPQPLVNATENILLVKQNSSLLPPSLTDMLTKRLNFPGSPLAFLFDPNLLPDIKLDKLTKYMGKYGEIDPETLPNQANVIFDVDIIAERILNARGVCRHRCQDFMLCTQLIGIQTRKNRSEEHVLCEVPYLQNNQVVHQVVDLGGGSRKDLTLLETRRSALADVEVTKMPSLATTQSLKKYYADQFYALARKNQLSSISELLAKREGKPALVQIPDMQSALIINERIVQHLKAQQFDLRKHLYIHRPQDLSLYLRPWKYVKGEFVRLNRGPLTDLIEQGGVLVVNWSNFTAREIAIYKSMLETVPTLKGQPVSKELKIINLAITGTESCSSFLSRTQPSSFLEEFYKAEVTPATISNTKSPLAVDLYNSIVWREKLFGKEETKNGVTELVEGELIKAIREKRPLIIYNAPESEDFKILMHHIEQEKKLYYNAEFLQISDATKIELATKSHELTLPNVKVNTGGLITNEHAFYIGMHNIHECYTRTIINGGKKQAFDSILKEYDPSKDVIYITDFIPQGEWQRLLQEIQTKHSHKNFQIYLAPLAEIEGVVKSPLSPNRIIADRAVQKTEARTFTTNDPDFFSRELAKEKENTLIVDITPSTRFSDLFYDVKLDKTQTKARFTHIEKGVLQALQQKRRVILNGDMSPSLYQQLLPLLSGQKTLESNGQQILITDKLLAVIPHTSKHNYALIDSTQRIYQIEDYQALVAQKDQKNFQKVVQFYTWANKLPHHGLGRPSAPVLNQQRIETMLRVLSSPFPLHKHNPVKDVFLYDYPRYSQDYAYLNVLAKALFQPKDAEPYRGEKLIKLLQRFDVQSFSEFKQHSWQVLNCFNGEMLTNLLGNNLENIQTNVVPPELSEQVLKKLHLDILRIQGGNQRLSVQAKATRSRFDKQKEQLESALADPNSLLINIKGTAGIGKTETVKKVIKDFYQGEQGILDWLQKGDKDILYLDEVNLAKPGTWNFLKGIARGTVFYQGKEFKLKPSQKIVTSYNPENYPNRFYHEFLQDYGRIIYFSKYDDAYLEKEIIAPILLAAGLNKPLFRQGLLSAFHLINEHSPYFTASTRDLENMAQRFLLLANLAQKENKGEAGLHQALLQAAIHEFSGAIQEYEPRENFILALEEKLNIKRVTVVKPPAFAVVDSHVLSAEKVYLVSAIEQDFLLRDQQIKEVNQLLANLAPGEKLAKYPFYKSGILLEGESGIGKSTLYVAMINRQIEREMSALGFQSQQKGTRAYEEAKAQLTLKYKYIKITAGEPTAYEKILAAFHDGIWVILDEINLDKNLENLLNQLLTGKDMEGNLPRKPGFRLLSSQNPGTYAGREPLSPAMLNRLHLLYMDEFTDKELVAIANWHVIDHGNDIVAGFREVQQHFPSIMTTGSFFDRLPTFKTAEQIVSKPLSLPSKQKPVNDPRMLSHDEQAGKKYYDQYYAALVENKVPEEVIIQQLKQHKEIILKYVETFDEQKKYRVYEEILNPDRPLGKLFWAKRQLFGLSPSLTRGVLEIVQERYTQLGRKLSIANAPKP